MNLQDKLKYYQSSVRQKDEPRSESSIDQHLNGRFVDERLPFAIKIEKRYPLHFIIPVLNGAPELSVPLISNGEFPDSIALNRLLLFDLETTGLAGGTGTYPFVQGFGYFEGGQLHIICYFLTDYGQDFQVYNDMQQLFSQKDILVSYNGKSYDLPLLRNRFVLNRLENPLTNFHHFDLLHSVRRIWKHTIPNCSLAQVEKDIFRFERIGDIDGAEIPHAYFDFLQTGFPEKIKRILEHNQLDIISMARLLFHLHDLETNQASSEVSETELLSLFRLAIKNDDLERSRQLIEICRIRNKEIPLSLWKEYSWLLRRRRHWEEAVAIWNRFLDSGKEILFATEELAKYYEHQTGDFRLAAEYVVRALKYLEISDELAGNSGGLISETREAFRYRLKRLERKAGLLPGQ